MSAERASKKRFEASDARVASPRSLSDLLANDIDFLHHLFAAFDL